MALAAPTLAKYQEFTSSGTSFVTSSWTPTASRLYLAWVNVYLTGSVVGIPTMSGNGLTWTEVTHTVAFDGNQRRGTLFMAYGSGTAGATTVSMGATSHNAAIVAILEQSGVTSTAAVLQSAINNTISHQSLTVTLGTFGDSANSTLGFYGYKTLSSGGATGMLPGSGFTMLVDDRIDTSRAVFVEYKLSSDTTVDASLTGSTDTAYTGAHHLAGVAIEIGAAAAWLVEAEVILAIDPNEIPDDGDVDTGTPPVVIDVSPSAPISDAQAPGARPVIARGGDLPSSLAALEQRLEAVARQQAVGMGFKPVLDEDPPAAEWVDGRHWVRSTTGEEVYVIGGVLQVRQPPTAIDQ